MLMIRRRTILAAGLALFTFFGSLHAAEQLPRELSDEAFWRLVTDLSEPAGYFRSDNLVSNEMTFQYVIPDLKKTTKADGVYLGVGPDQNFTYIVALQPKIAFIVDIRRGNMLQHLMYKALIELSEDRAEFLSRLFSRPRPEGIGPKSSPEDLFEAFDEVAPDPGMYTSNFAAIKKQLGERHGFKLSSDDEENIDFILRAFYSGGPDLTYNGPNLSAAYGGRGGARMPSYGELMVQTDGNDLNRSYMSNEDNFRILQDLEKKNLIVPIVGDFAGPKALGSVGRYLKEHEASVTAFYLSNVEQYLFQQGEDWSRFYTNVGKLPVDSSALFIRSVFNNLAPVQSQGFGGLRSASMLSSIPALLKAFAAGEIRAGSVGYYDVIQMSK